MYKSGRDIFTKSEKLAARLDDVVEKLVSAFNPEKIILFGSYARGDYKEKISTMDLIIVAETKLRFSSRIKKALEVCKGDTPPIEPIIYTPEEYSIMLDEAQEAFLFDALDEGIVIYNKDDSNVLK